MRRGQKAINNLGRVYSLPLLRVNLVITNQDVCVLSLSGVDT